MFINAESRVKKPQSWSDDLHTYVLLSQEETVLQEGTEDEVEGYVSSYIQYTHDEFQDLITRGLREQTINQLDQSLEAVRSNKIAESKQLLEQYYQANKNLLPEKIYSINGSTEPAILQGLDVAMIPGEERNFKITTREDLMRFQRMTGEV